MLFALPLAVSGQGRICDAQNATDRPETTGCNYCSLQTDEGCSGQGVCYRQPVSQNVSLHFCSCAYGFVRVCVGCSSVLILLFVAGSSAVCFCRSRETHLQWDCGSTKVPVLCARDERRMPEWWDLLLATGQWDRYSAKYLHARVWLLVLLEGSTMCRAFRACSSLQQVKSNRPAAFLRVLPHWTWISGRKRRVRQFRM